MTDDGYGDHYGGECWGGPWDGEMHVCSQPVMPVMVLCSGLTFQGYSVLAPAENVGYYRHAVRKRRGRWYWRSTATAKEPDAAGA